MTCVACGRVLSNDPAKPNAAKWTSAPFTDTRDPYCADSDDCARDAHNMVGVTWHG